MYLSDVLTQIRPEHLAAVQQRLEDPDCYGWLEPLIQVGGDCSQVSLQCKECPLRLVCTEYETFEIQHFLLRAAARGFKTKTGGIQ